MQPYGWEHVATYTGRCAEDLAELGMTGVTAQAFHDPCDSNAAALQYRRAAPGSSGGSVVAVQTALVAAGYQLPIDGTFGPLTEAAIVDYQTAHGLIIDGVAGRETQGSLGI